DVLVLDGLEPADPRGDVDADVVGDVGSDLQARITHREVRGRNGVLDEDVHLLDVLLFDELQRIEPLHLAGNTRGVLRCVEVRDRPDAAVPGAQRIPVGLRPDADRRQQADARDDYSPRQQRLRTTSSWRGPRCTRWLPSRV